MGGWSGHAQAAEPPGSDPLPIVLDAGRALKPVWNSAENLAPPGFNTWIVQPVDRRYID